MKQRHLKTGYAKTCQQTAVVLMLFLLSGCAGETYTAPVVNLSASHTTNYVVRSGDTFYSIAWAHDVDPATLSRTNHSSSPYSVHVGQLLKIPQTVGDEGVDADVVSGVAHIHQSDVVYETRPIPPAHRSKIKPAQRLKVKGQGHWLWPISGSVVETYQPGQIGGNRGIDLRVCPGRSVRAAHAGEVVYSGAGLKGYGQLIIIKHSAGLMSAYAYNQKRLVQVGTHVKAGQRIALSGQSPAGAHRLHFEVRRHGRPVDPLQYLKGGPKQAGTCQRV